MIRKEYFDELVEHAEWVDREVKHLAFFKRLLEEEKSRYIEQMLKESKARKR